jgi:uncharacterized membrane protein
MLEIVVNIFNMIAIVLVIVIWVYTFRKYKFLPQQIPTHFDLEQKPDAFGSKKFAFFLPVLSVVMVAVLIFAGEFSGGNYPVKITKENFNAQFSIMRVLMSWLSIVLAFIFFNIQDYMLRLSLDAQAKPRVHLFLPLVFIFIGVVTAIIFAYIYK